MKTKEYKLSKSIAKTARENNLVVAENNISNGKILFDFSELNNVEISENEKNVIREDSLENVCASNKESFYGMEFDDYSLCIGRALYYAYKVYNTSGKRLYVIMQFVKLEHTHTERKSIYDNWNSTKITYDGEYQPPFDDFEV